MYEGSNCLDPLNSAVWQFLTDNCWNCIISFSTDVISIWLLFILIWFCVVSKWWWDLVNCMVWIFLLYDGLNQLCIGFFFKFIWFLFSILIFWLCSSVSGFKQMQTEILLMYMMQLSRFKTPWTTQTFLIWQTLVPLHSTRTSNRNLLTSD
jgi:hypothetical protein